VQNATHAALFAILILFMVDTTQQSGFHAMEGADSFGYPVLRLIFAAGLSQGEHDHGTVKPMMSGCVDWLDREMFICLCSLPAFLVWAAVDCGGRVLMRA